MKRIVPGLLFFLAGAAVGWYFSDSQRQLQLFIFLHQVEDEFLRSYDEQLSFMEKKQLATKWPELFAFPYFCRVEQVTPNIPIMAKQEKSEITYFSEGSLLRAGVQLQTKDQVARIDCEKYSLYVLQNSKLYFGRKNLSEQSLLLSGEMFLAAKKATKLNYTLENKGNFAVELVKDSLLFLSNLERSKIEVLQASVDLEWEAIPSLTSRKKEIFSLYNARDTRAKIRTKDFPTTKELPSNTFVLLFSDHKLSSVQASEINLEANIGRYQLVSSYASNNFANEAANVNEANHSELEQAAIVEDNIAAKTQEATTISIEKNVLERRIAKRNHKKGVDILLKWTSSAGREFLPCKILFSQDNKFKKILARYESEAMQLKLKGLQKGNYFWKVQCEKASQKIDSGVGKIIVRR